MPDFSIIVPVYNTSKYLKKCLDSILNQSYKNFEVIVINDGSTDDSDAIIKKYSFIKYFKTENQGLSCARNLGVEKSLGKYLLFVDSDDYIESDLLLNLSKNFKDDPDLIRFQVKENNKSFPEVGFKNLKGPDAFKRIVRYHIVESACLYAIQKEFYIQNNFSFAPHKYHEDFCLIPLVILKANKVISIPYIGYGYLQRDNSIMTNKDIEKNYTKALHIYEHYLFLLNEVEKIHLDSETLNIFKSYIATSTIIVANNLNKENKRRYLNLLKENKVIDNTLNNSLKRKLKRLIFRINPMIYVRLFK